MSEELVVVSDVGKKFCRSLKHSLLYGVQDIAKDLLGVDASETDLRKKEFWANSGISFELKRGECIGLVGHNGAGKTTLLKMLNGLIRPDRGSIHMRGRVGALIALGAGFNPILTGRENIFINGSVLGLSKKEIEAKLDRIIDFAEISEFIDTPVQNYSSGMQVRLGFAIASQMDPDILLIDEVLAVGDLGFRIKCLNRISEMLADTAVIFVSHSMSQVSKICNKAILLEKGQIKMMSSDVGDVVREYHNSFSSENVEVVDTGVVELVECGFTGEVANDINYKYGEAVEFHFTLNFKSECARAGVLFIIDNQDDRSVLAVFDKSFHRFELKNIQGAFHGRVVLKDVALPSGKYSINCHVVDEETHLPLLQINRVLRFTCVHTVTTAADVFVSGDWHA